MHRSGTSALAGALQHLGVEVGRELVEPTRDNPRGYFENLTTVLAQEDLFEAIGYRWHDPRPLPSGWLAGDPAGATRDVLAGVVEELFADAHLAAIKDPRSCRLVPLWRDVAKQARVTLGSVLMLRHPGEVAASLHRRDDMSRTRAYLLWSRYLLEAERETRAMPRAFVAYDALLEDWRREMDRIGSGLAIAMPEVTGTIAAEVDGFLDNSLRNHVGVPDEQGDSPFEALAMSLYDLALRCVDGSVKDADKQFDELASRLDVLAQPYLEAVQDSLALEVPVQMEAELQSQGLDKSRTDMALQLAALRELWRPATLARAPGACKLYYRDESTSFAEARTVSVQPVAMQNTQMAVFELPVDAKVSHLRIDPDDVPGVYAVHSLSVGGRVIDDLGERVTAINELPLPATFTAAVRFAALAEDPHFELDARGFAQFAETDGVMRIEMRFRVETVASQIGEQIQGFGEGLQHGYQKLARQQRDLMKSAAAISCAVDEGRQAQREDSARSRELNEAIQSATVAITEKLAALHEYGAVIGTLHQEQHGELVLALRALQTSQEQLSDETADMRQQQSTLMNWAQRRSPGYWWNRLLGRNHNKKISG